MTYPPDPRDEYILSVLIASFASGDLTLETGLAIMTLLHIYRVYFPPGVIADCPNLDCLHAQTQRCSASLVSDLFERLGKGKGNYAKWYWDWNLTVHAGGEEELSPIWRERVSTVKNKIEAMVPNVRWELEP